MMVNRRNEFQERVAHVRFEGTSRDITFGVLDVGDLSSDEDVRQALANTLNVPVRHANGNMTVRPKAVFG
jgi:hypothetical protein